MSFAVALGKIKFSEIKSPKELLPDEVLLEIKKIGVCGSDIHVWHGKHPFLEPETKCSNS